MNLADGPTRARLTAVMSCVDDHRRMHGVTPVTPIDPEKPAHRDVLVVTLRDAASGARR